MTMLTINPCTVAESRETQATDYIYTYICTFSSGTMYAL